MKNRIGPRATLKRFLTDRKAYGERPDPLAELLVWALVFLTTGSAIVPLANALAAMR